MKNQVYFVRRHVKDGMYQPYAAVCLGYYDKDNDPNQRIYCRGVSICSDVDSFDKKYATDKAYGMMVKAAVNNVSSYDISDNHPSAIRFKNQTNIQYKSEFNASLSNKEMSIMRILERKDY